jgi:hypothetical protein
MAVAKTAVGKSKNNAITGRSNVPNPNPLKKLIPDPKSATTKMKAYSIQQK